MPTETDAAARALAGTGAGARGAGTTDAAAKDTAATGAGAPDTGVTKAGATDVGAAGQPDPEAHPLRGRARAPFGVYVHVPFCATRCGYCDFNTYTPTELAAGSSTATWLAGLRAELAGAAAALGEPPAAETVFVGGGTPSLLGAAGLTAVLDAVRESFGLSPTAEVTTEANPESTDPEFFAGIRAAGYTRVSLGMQSAAEHVLAVLDRVHSPGRPLAAAREARAAGFEHISLDLIYGAPGERPSDLRASLDTVLDSGADHVSAYALIVEQGTALARKVARGEIAAPEDDVLAEYYELIDGVLGAAGLGWYEVSNWAASHAARCRHNEGYWRSGDWWGAGPGAHSHIDGLRWANVKHPARYSGLLAAGESPVTEREVLSETEQHTERVMLGIRTAEGLALDALDSAGRAEAAAAADDGLLDAAGFAAGRAVLTPRGRLLADAVVRRLLA